MNEDQRYALENISIAIVDDHEVVLEGYRSFFVKNGIDDIETFSQAHSLLDRVKKKHFDVYIVDVELPDMDAYSLIDEIRTLHPEAKIVINTIHDEPWIVSKLTDKNVDGVVYKSGNLHQLIKAVGTVVYGKQYYNNEFKKTQERLRLQNDIPSNRELEVLKYIAQGLSTKEIGKKLFISENTVSNHRKSLFHKLQAKNMVDLIVKAITGGYLNLNKEDGKK